MSHTLRLLLLLLLVLTGCQDDPGTVNDTADATPRLGAFSHVTVGVQGLEAALSLWRDRFGMEEVASRRGPDAALAELWGLEAEAIAAQALLRTPGLNTGWLHLVEFSRPGKPVREGAEVFDTLPKNLDVYVQDMPIRYEEMLAAGVAFRSRWTEMASPDGGKFREVQMGGHDDTNIVLLEILDTNYVYGPTGYAGIGPVIIVVKDADRETNFYTDVLGLEMLMEDLLAGPAIEKMVGLPSGAGIDFRVLGDAQDPMGRIEVIEYQKTRGTDRMAMARAPATGFLHANWQVDSLQPLTRQLEASDIAFTDHGELDTIYGTGRVISFTTPAGFRIEVQESPPGQ